MKRAFILFWHGLTALFVGIANWFTVILGMRDDSKYGKFLRRVVGSSFALIMLLLALNAGWSRCRSVYYRYFYNRSDSGYGNSQYISRNVAYYSYDGADGYVRTFDGKTTISDILWIAKPLGEDSLICYNDGEKRGYFNMFTGEPVIKPKYDHAWVFSDGLAAVDDGGWIKFIDATGKVALDLKLPYMPAVDGYVFHNGYCVVHNDRRDRVGLIDKQGKWVLKPEYFSISSQYKYWVVNNGKGECVLDSALNTVLPYTDGHVWVSKEYIGVTLSNHVIQRYSLNGELINDFYINDVYLLTYDTDELRYVESSASTNDEEIETSETEASEPHHIKMTAKCRMYETETGWYGLMTAEGKVVTPPSYSEITAISYDSYLCKDSCSGGIILNGKGERIR